MNGSQVAAQLLGCLGIIVYVVMYHSKDVKHVLQKKLAIDVIWGVHYLILGAYTGCATNVICCAREIVFMNKDKKVFQSRLWLVLFLILNWISAGVMWKGFYSILPAMSATLGTISFWQKNIKTARIFGILINLCMFAYDVCVLSYMGMVGEVLAFLSVICALIKQKRNEENEVSI